MDKGILRTGMERSIVLHLIIAIHGQEVPHFTFEMRTMSVHLKNGTESARNSGGNSVHLYAMSDRS